MVTDLINPIAFIKANFLREYVATYLKLSN